MEVTLPNRKLSRTPLQPILIFGKVLLYAVNFEASVEDNVHAQSLRLEGRISSFNLTFCSSWVTTFHKAIDLLSQVAFPWLKYIIKSKLVFFFFEDRDGKYTLLPGSLIQN